MTPYRFRRCEALLSKMLEPAVAELASMLIAAWIVHHQKGSLDAADILDPDDPMAIRLTRLAVAGERTPEATWDWIYEANLCVHNVFGFTLFALSETCRDQRRTLDARVPFSQPFRDLLSGQAFTLFSEPSQRQSSSPDAATEHWLDIVATAVRHGKGAAFLYRHSASHPASDYGPLLSDLRLRLGDCRIFIASAPRFRSPRLSPAGLLLSAGLHLDPDDLLVLPHAGGIGQTAPDIDDAEEPDISAAPPSIGSNERVLVAILGEIPLSLLMAIEPATRIASEIAKAFSAIFGPYRRDMRLAAQTLIEAPGNAMLSPQVAHRLIDALDDPQNARGILETASALAMAAHKPKSDSCDTFEADDVVAEEFAHFDGIGFASEPDTALQRTYNEYVAELAGTFHAHMPQSATSYAFHAGAFDPELFVSDPHPSFLFERAAFLRKAGVRIILTGPPGTGKTALVGELSRRMGLPVRQWDGGQLFARGWGQAERNIKAAITQSRGALLFLDEADTLLGMRDGERDGNQHLVVTATGAFLSAIQDPQPHSPVIIATNRLDSIDSAIRRRFDVVVETKALPPGTEIIAWQRLLGLTPPPGWTPQGGTVPADYVKAARQMAFLGESGPAAAVAALARARRDRDNARQENSRVGFL